MKYFTIILPVYNDWDCLQILLGQIEDTLKGTEANFELLLINDGSNNFSNLNFNKKKCWKSKSNSNCFKIYKQ